MLLAARVENHRSIDAEQELTLVRSGGKSKNIADTDADGKHNHISKLAGIYGANAAGKSNILSGIQFMSRAVRRSQQNWDPDGGVPLSPFAFNDETLTVPSRFEVEILLDSTRYQYGFAATRDEITSEWLYAYPRGRRRVLFERQSQDNEEYYFGDSLQGQNRITASFTRKNSLFLSAAHSFDHDQLSPIARWISDKLKFADPANLPSRLKYTLESLRKDSNLTDIVLRFLQAADLGISGINIRERQMNDEQKTQFLRILEAVDPDNFDPKSISDAEFGIQRDFELEHTCEEPGASKRLPFTNESTGTKALLALLGPILHALRNGHTLFVDEIDTSLHPRLVTEVIRIFQDAEMNKKEAQLVFTSHDTSVLGMLASDEPLLERDQIWFVEKGRSGASSLFPLTDFSPRKLENIERGYLQGRYGGVPIVSRRGLEMFAQAVESTDNGR
ncbi:hypothetical protein SAMN04487917_107188 [Arthrobacter sp. yr096]|uniref:AAA family ATPase n=1 Tax=Arthrobacter sp. yr096 TaxID=1761750 RepID=UPI0008CA5D45|nr:ATP-binding protein [Arthrobacter sp. yr096]SEJ58625.1 hypothetical protein SAMN04487917_107188 [Arthrobacter sp. yr096]